MTHSVGVRRRHPVTADAGLPVSPSRYEFRIRGRIGELLLAGFEGFDAEVEPVETVLRGDVADQAALHGVLEQIQALGLELVELRQIDDPRRPGAAARA